MIMLKSSCGYRSIRPGSTRPTSTPNAVDPPQLLGRSAPSFGSFRPNTHKPQYTLICNKLFHRAHRRRLVNIVYDIQILIDMNPTFSIHNIKGDVGRTSNVSQC